MSRKKYNDEFGDEGSFIEKVFNRRERAELPSGLRKLVVGVAASAFVIFLGIAAINSMDENKDGDAVPIIRADDTPVKIKPDDRGGMKVANKNSTIFDTLKTAQDDAKVENLLEDEEAPVQKEQVFKEAPKPAAAAVAPAPVKEEKKPVETKPAVAVADDKTMPPQPEAESSDEILDQDLLAEKPEPVKPEPVKTEPQPAPVAVQPVKPVTPGGSSYVQLASVKSEADAQRQWTTLKAKNPELAALSLRVQKADLGEKGIYYRVQAGPVADASSVCAAIKGRGGSCLVAK